MQCDDLPLARPSGKPQASMAAPTRIVQCAIDLPRFVVDMIFRSTLVSLSSLERKAALCRLAGVCRQWHKIVQRLDPVLIGSHEALIFESALDYHLYYHHVLLERMQKKSRMHLLQTCACPQLSVFGQSLARHPARSAGVQPVCLLLVMLVFARALSL